MTTFGAPQVWLLISLMAAGTLALRVSFLGIAGRTGRIPDPVRRVLRFIPAAVLAALVVPALLRPDGAFDVTFGNHRLLAGIAASVVAWRTRNVFATIAAGMVILWLLDALA